MTDKDNKMNAHTPMAQRRALAFDFDGVIHIGYDGWRDGTIYGTIDHELMAYIAQLMSAYDIIISSTRPAAQIAQFLTAHGYKACPFEGIFWHSADTIGVTNLKPAAVAYIDDRAVRYTGMAQLKEFLAKEAMAHVL